MGRLEEVIGTNIIRTSTGEIRLGHTWYEVSVLEDVIQRESPEWFIEIGVHEGGLSYLLIPEFPFLKYMGVEYNLVFVRKEVIDVYNDNNRLLIIDDCFNLSLMNRISKLPKKLIYCDGGNKVKELLAYKNICKKGDFIFAHDYYDGKRKVLDVPVANISIEVKPEDILHLDKDFRFERYPETFLDETRIVGWKYVG